MAVPAPLMPSETPPSFEPPSSKTDVDCPTESDDSAKAAERAETPPLENQSTGNMGQRKTDSAKKQAAAASAMANVTNVTVNGLRIQPTPPGMGPNCETPPPAMVPEIPNVASPPTAGEFPPFDEDSMAKYGIPPG